MDIPIEERIYDKYSAQFQCPACSVWLQADKQFKFFSTLGLLLIAISVMVGLFNMMGLLTVDYAPLYIIAGVGFFITLTTSIVVKTEVVKTEVVKH
jgi:hypothetical protein